MKQWITISDACFLTQLHYTSETALLDASQKYMKEATRMMQEKYPYEETENVLWGGFNKNVKGQYQPGLRQKAPR
jgi:hypothetical protein